MPQCKNGHEENEENTRTYLSGEKVCRVCERKRTRKYADKDLQKRREKRVSLKLEVMSVYSNGRPKCACCGNMYLPHLTIDHINENGYEQKGTGIRSGNGLLKWLENNGYPADFQVLCANCNLAKHLLGKCGCQDVQTPDQEIGPE